MSAAGGLPEATGDRLIHSATALLVSNVTGALLGVAFWAVAARLYRPEDVGDGVAEIAAMVLLASLAQLSLGVIFPRYLHDAGARAAWVLGAGYAASVTLALVLGTAFTQVTGYHEFLHTGALASVAFVAAVVLWTVFTIQDGALIGLRATFWVPVENTSFSAVKIVLLPIFVVVAPSSGVFNSWVLPVIACIIPINYYLFAKVLPAHVVASRGIASLPSRRAVGSVLTGEYLGGMAYIALVTLPALLIAGRLGTSQAAYFQTPWLAGTSFDFLLFSIATSLIVESSVRPGAAAAGVRRAVRLTILLLTPGMVVLVVGAPFFLRILGPDYARHGTRLLQLLALTLPFMAVNVLYVTFARLARRVRRILAVQVCVAALILGLMVALLGPLGITGAGVAFLCGQALVALVVLPSVVRQYRRTDMAPDFAQGAELVAKGVLIVRDEADGASAEPSLGDEHTDGCPCPGATPPRHRRRTPSWVPDWRGRSRARANRVGGVLDAAPARDRR